MMRVAAHTNASASPPRLNSRPHDADRTHTNAHARRRKRAHTTDRATSLGQRPADLYNHGKSARR